MFYRETSRPNGGFKPKIKAAFFKEKPTVGSGVGQAGHKPYPKGKALVSGERPSFSSSPSFKDSARSWVSSDASQVGDLGATSSAGGFPDVLRTPVSTGCSLPVSVPVGSRFVLFRWVNLPVGLSASFQWPLFCLRGYSRSRISQ